MKDLAVGEAVWTTPWTMQLDKDGNLWIDEENREFSYEPYGEQPVNLRVIADEGGYIVDLSCCPTYQWGVRDTIENGKPVVAIRGAGHQTDEIRLPLLEGVGPIDTSSAAVPGLPRQRNQDR